MFLVVAGASFGTARAALQGAPDGQGAGSVEHVEQVHQQPVVRGLGDGAVQAGVPGFEAFEVGAGASGVEAGGDAVEVGLGGHARREDGDLGFEQ